MDELDLTCAESKATYDEIQKWVQDNYKFHVTYLNIAQVKRKHGIIDTPEEAGELIPIKAVYRPNMENKAVYERNYQVFCKLYKSNAKHFKALNGC